MKITAPQQRIVDRMRTHVLHQMTGRNAYYFWCPAVRDERAPSAASVHAIYKLGFIFQVKDGVGSFHYELTDAGRAALALQGTKP